MNKHMKRPKNFDYIDWALKFCWLSPSGCWIYVRSTDRVGYVQISNGTKLVMAHRAVYEREYGPIKEGLEIDHTCNTRNCLNPSHMEQVTRSENVRRSSAWKTLPNVITNRTGICKRGHNNMKVKDVGGGKLAKYCVDCRKLSRKNRTKNL